VPAALRLKGAWTLWRQVPRLFPYLRPYRRLVATSVVLTAAAAGITLAEPWPVAFMVDSVLGKKAVPAPISSLIGANTYALLIFGALLGLAVAAVANGLSVLVEFVNTKLEQRLILDFRSDLFRHAQRLSLGYHDEISTGQLMSQINYESEAAGTLLMSILPLAQSAITLIGMFWITYTLDPLLALLALTVVPFIYYSVGFYSARIVPRLQYVRGLEWEAFSIIYEAMQMLRVVVAFGREGHEFRRFRSQGETAVDARVKLTIRQTLFSLAVNTLTAAGTALVLGFGALHVLHHRLTVGELLVLLAYIAAVYKPLETVSSTMGSLQQQLVMVQGAFMLLDSEPEIRDAPDAIEARDVRGEIEFANVGFTYPGRDETLTDISFRVEAGACVALVGPTGAGKTTLVSLLTRFFDPQSGRILLDGVDTRQLQVKSLREQISVVLQTPQLFSGTIAENIRYGRLDASVEEIVAAAEAANVHESVAALPQGYETLLGEGGAQLSGGERQRICVARAFLKDAPVLILDEPTSAIDSKTEGVILDALDQLMVGRTTFMIAHRLSTVRHADLIVVLDQGRVVEQGTHEQLMFAGGLYRHLWEVQVGRRRRRGVAADRLHGADAVLAELERVSNGNGADQDAAARLLLTAIGPLVEEGDDDPLRVLAARHDDRSGEIALAAELAERLLGELTLREAHG
jgi:ATP-binding cassette subfamily B protein/subfamily B ATP-binding cassette protein MsbA